MSQDTYQIPIIYQTVDINRYDLIDNCMSKTAKVKFYDSYACLMLWQGEEYDAIGDYTQQQVTDRIKEILGDNPEEVLKANLGG